MTSIAPAAVRADKPRRSGFEPWTLVTAGLLGLAALQAAGMAILWFLPYQTAGLLNETGLMTLAALAGLAAYPLLRRGRLPPRRGAICLAASLYSLASMAGLGWSADRGVALGAYRYALFSTPYCDFTARFERPPQLGRLRGAAFEAERLSVDTQSNLAILSDLENFNSYRAECQPIDAAAKAAPRDVVQAAAQHWAAETGLKIARQTQASDGRGDIIGIDGEVGGSILPETPGEKSRTLVTLRSYVGPRSIMTLYVFQPRGEALSEDTLAFLDGVRRR